ncbi:MAG: 2,3-bisphosphoglycerate-dependent phosphoglycerate mutase [Niabella sp.]
MSELILIRHGQSQWNLENKFTGWKDPDITEKGEQEAHHAAEKIRNEKIDIAFTSVLVRAQHTLRIIMEDNHWDIPVIKDAALNERAYGSLEGLNKAETAKKYGEEQVHIWRRSYDVAPPDGESLKMTYERVLPYFKSAILPYLVEGENVLIAAHGNSLRSLIMYLERLTPAQILKRELDTGVPVIYHIDKETLSEMERSENFKALKPKE